MTRRWIDALRDAITRQCILNGSNYFTRQQLIKRQLDQIVQEVDPKGPTPHQSLSYYLQKLRDLGEICFLGNKGNYKRII